MGERGNETIGEWERGWGSLLGKVSHCEQSAVIILLHHLRQAMPHPSAHGSVAHGNCKIVYVSECVHKHLCMLGGGAEEVMRCQHLHMNPGCGLLIVSAFN